MAEWLAVVQGAAVLNVILLAGLAVIWTRNYLTFRSKHSLGFLVFGLALLAENAYAVHVFMLHPKLSAWFTAPGAVPPEYGTAMMGLRVLETGAILFLTWVTLD